MKKLSLLALPLALLALGSCDNNSVIPGDNVGEMSFAPVTNFKNSTRGYTTGSAFNEITYENLIKEAGEQAPQSRVMNISAYLTPQHGTAKAYFTNNTFKEHAGSGIWRNYNGDEAEPIFWPIGATVDFLAFSTTQECAALASQAIWSNNNPTEEISMTVTPQNCTQNDILYAGAYGIASKQETGSVNMEFKHTQAWLTFKLTGDVESTMLGEDPTSIVHFQRIELEQAYNAGKLIIYKSSDNTAKAKWDLNSMNAGKVTVDNDRSEKVEDLTMEPQQLDMLVPEQQKCAFTIYYKLGSDPIENSYRFTLDNDFWQMGQHYVYNIHISATEIKVIPTVLEWGENEYTTLHSDKFSMKAIGGATVGKLMVNGEEFDPMKLYKTNETLTIKAVANGDDHFRWEDSTSIKTNDLKMTAKEFNDMENPMKVLFYTKDVIPFAYSVADGKTVYFSNGNLFADKSSGSVKFAFEEKQYYFRTRPDKTAKLAGGGVTPLNTSGLFQWDPKASDFGAFGSRSYDDLNSEGSPDDVLDFGQAMGSGWAALSSADMDVLLSLLEWNDDVSSVKGCVLKPNGFEGAIPGDYDWDTNPSGLVFLPAAGYFYDGSVDDVGDNGCYWSSSAYDTEGAYLLYFGDGYSSVGGLDRCSGNSVRLVWR